MALRVYLLKPLQALALRAPGDSTALAHGPAVASASLDQPFPTALAGALASHARLAGLCNPSSCGADGFENLRVCLEKLLGNGFHLYTGPALDEEGRVWLPTPSGYVEAGTLPQLLDALRRGVSRGYSELAENARRPSKRPRVGIALSPVSKTVRPGLLYSIEEHLPPRGLHQALIVDAPGAAKLPALLATAIGGKRRLSLLAASERQPGSLEELLVHGGGCEEWLLYLASPALLDESPWSPGAPVRLTQGAGRELARALLGGQAGAAVEAVYVPKTRPGLEAIAPGWCTPEQRPRRPYLHVPAGTAIWVKGLSPGAAAALARRGLGYAAELGWGTVAALCAPAGSHGS